MPLDVKCDAVTKIRDGTITRYRYRPEAAALLLRSEEGDDRASA